MKLVAIALIACSIYGVGVAASYATGKPSWYLADSLHQTYMMLCTLGHSEREAKCTRGDASE